MTESKRKPLKLIFVAGVLIAVALAVFVSPHASAWPDGLQRVASKLGFIGKAENKTAWKSAPAAGYNMPGVKSNKAGVALAGLAGTLAVLAAGWGLAAALRKRKPRRGAETPPCNVKSLMD